VKLWLAANCGHLMQVVADNSVALDHTHRVPRTHEPTQVAWPLAGRTIRQNACCLVACWSWRDIRDASPGGHRQTNRQTDGDGQAGIHIDVQWQTAIICQRKARMSVIKTADISSCILQFNIETVKRCRTQFVSL